MDAKEIESLYQSVFTEECYEDQEHAPKSVSTKEDAQSILDYAKASMKKPKKALGAAEKQSNYSVSNKEKRLFIQFEDLNVRKISKVPRPLRQGFVDKLYALALERLEFADLNELELVKQQVLDLELYVFESSEHKVAYRGEAAHFLGAAKSAMDLKKFLATREIQETRERPIVGKASHFLPKSSVDISKRKNISESSLFKNNSKKAKRN